MSMTLRVGLKGRFLLATLTLSCVLVGGFTLAILLFLELVEDEFVHLHFSSEFQKFVTAYQTDPTHPLPLPAGYRAFIVQGKDYRNTPAGLDKVQTGVRAEVALAGTDYTVGRAEVGDASIFVLVASAFEPVEKLESQLLKIAGVVGCLALLFSGLMALWLARHVIHPVRELAERTDAIQPGAPREPLVRAPQDPEIERIAIAFERVLDGFDTLVAREVAFTRDASHELRTPLAVMLTTLELLALQTVSDEVGSKLQRVRAAALQMRVLIDGLLFLARPEDVRTHAVINAREVILDAVRIQRLALGAKAPDIQLVMPVDVQLKSPRGLFLCVVNNLLRNALEHAGGRGISISLGENELLVEDEGGGIPPDIAMHVFEREVRGDASTGLGRGLYIVKRICDTAGWRIAIENVDRKSGTRFCLSFR